MWKYSQVCIGVLELIRTIRHERYERARAERKAAVIDPDFRAAAK